MNDLMFGRSRVFHWILLVFSCALIYGWSLYGTNAVVYSDEVNVVGNEPKSTKLDEEENKAFDKAVGRIGAPWYDSKSHTVKFLPNAPKTKDEDRYVPKVEDKLEKLGKIIYWTCVGIFFLLVLACVIWAFLTLLRIREKNRRKNDADERKKRERRLETLAPEARERFDDLLNAAKDALAQGRLREATIFYFSWILVEMDKREFVLLERGKTNLAYWRELERVDDLRSIYRAVMKQFERVYFGGRTITQDEFETVWNLQSRFEEIMRKKDDEIRERNAQLEPDRSTEALFNLSSRICLFLAPAFFCAFLGCDRTGQEYWCDEYENRAPGRYHTKDLNSLYAYKYYCEKSRKFHIKEDYYPNKDSYDAIVWNASDYREFRWEKVDPLGQQEPQRRKAWLNNLKRYASASDDDWYKFTVTPEYDLFQVTARAITEWLHEKPGRTFIFVYNRPSSALDYWLAVREVVNNYEDKSLRESCLVQCDDHIRKHLFDDREVLRKFYKGEFVKLRIAAKRILDEYEKEPSYINSYFEVTPSFTNVFHGVDDEEEDSDFENDIVFDDNNNEKPDYIKNKPIRPINTRIDAPFFSSLDYMNDGIDLGADWKVDDKSKKGDDNGENDREDPSFRLEDRWSRQVVQRWRSTPWSDESLDPRTYKRQMERFSGSSDWIATLPEYGAQTEQCVLTPGEDIETLVQLGDVPLICRYRIGGSQLLIVNSSSFLTNFGLTDETNRKLASRLTDEIKPGSNVDWVEGRFQGFRSNSDRRVYYSPEEKGPFSLTKASPYTVFIWHVAMLTTIVFFCYWPIFGRPKRMIRERNNDFGRHIEAAASRLEDIGGESWVRTKIDEYLNEPSPFGDELDELPTESESSELK